MKRILAFAPAFACGFLVALAFGFLSAFGFGAAFLAFGSFGPLPPPLVPATAIDAFTACAACLAAETFSPAGLPRFFPFSPFTWAFPSAIFDCRLETASGVKTLCADFPELVLEVSCTTLDC